MSDKPKKIVTGLYVTTIVGYVVVGLVVAFSLYLGISFLFGVFNRDSINLTGLQFKEKDITISENGGTAEVTLFSPDGILQDQIAQDAAEKGEEAKTAVYKVSSVEITVQDDAGNAFSNNNSPITLPSMNEIHLGKPFTVKANLSKAKGDDSNIGGDCYLSAKVVDNEGKIYLTKEAIHIFVDVPIKSITAVRAVGINEKADSDKIEHEVDDDNTFDIVTSYLYVDDKISLEVEVSPKRALQPHTASIYTEVGGDNYVAPKKLTVYRSNEEYLTYDEENNFVTFLKNVTNASNMESLEVHVDSIYDKTNPTFTTPMRVIKFAHILTPEKGDFVVDFSNEIFKTVDKLTTLGVDLRVPQDGPSFCFVSHAFENPVANESDNEELKDNISQFIALSENDRVINLDVKIASAGVKDDQDEYQFKSFNTLYPKCLQDLSGFNISYSSTFKNGDSVIQKPNWLVDNYSTPIRIEMVQLGPQGSDLIAWFVYVEREVEQNEIANIAFDVNGIAEKTQICGVDVNIKPFNQLEANWENLLVNQNEIEFDKNSQSTTFNCEITKDGDLETNVVEGTSISIPLKTKIDVDSTYTRLIYLVKVKQKQSEGMLTDLTLNYNSVECKKVKTNVTQIIFDGEIYNMLDMSNGNYYLTPVGAGTVKIYPFLVKTNLSGEPIDYHYHVITSQNCTGAVKQEALSNLGENTNYDYSYVLIPVSELSEKTYNLDVLTVNIKEKLTGFRFYDSTDFFENIETFYYEGSASNSIFVLGNSSLALNDYADANFRFENSTFDFVSEAKFNYLQSNTLYIGQNSSISISLDGVVEQTSLTIKDVSDQTKTIVFKDENELFKNQASVTLRECVMDSESTVDNLSIYFENADLVRPYYQANLGGNLSYEQWHSRSINTKFLLLNANEKQELNSNISLTQEEYIHLLLNGILETTDKEENSITIKWENGKLYVYNGQGSSIENPGTEIEDSEDFYGSDGILGTMLSNSDGVSTENVTAKVYTQNGLIYALDDELLEQLNTMDEEDNKLYHLFCVAYDDETNLSLGHLAFMEINLEFLDKSYEIDVHLTKEEQTVDDNVRVFCSFDSENLFQVNLSGVNVYTTLWFENVRQAGLTYIGDETLKENCADGNIRLDDNTKYKLELKPDKTNLNDCILGAINLTVKAKRGIFINKKFVAVKYEAEDDTLQEMTFDISVKLKLILGNPPIQPQQNDDNPDEQNGGNPDEQVVDNPDEGGE